ncbi:hypothetical protein Q3304_09140 [Clostridioides sp. GD02377]|uniref:hypothetical protein n=1 Tax=unclassified Clostridioides TaxID=2635829 RepID=UPI0038B10AF2
MRWIKWYSIICISIFLIIGLFILIDSNKVQTVTTRKAFYLVESKVPNEAKYQGYKKNQINGTTTIYYSYDDAVHTVRLSHPENNSTREINWDEVINIKFD